MKTFYFGFFGVFALAYLAYMTWLTGYRAGYDAGAEVGWAKACQVLMPQPSQTLEMSIDAGNLRTAAVPSEEAK